MPTRREKEAAQRADREAVEQREAEARTAARARRRTLALAAGAAGVLVVALLLVLGLRGGDDEPDRVQPSDAPAAAVQPALDEFDALPQDGIVLGDPNAPYTLVEFGDLVCAGCKVYAEEILPRVIREYVRPGQLRFEYRPLGFARDWSTPAAQYAWAAAEQNQLFPFVKAWYANQGDEDTDYVDDAFARRVAGAVDGLDAERLVQDAQKPEIRDQLDDAARGFLTLDQEQVPAFAAGPTGEPVRPIDLGTSPQTASAAISGLMRER